MIPSTADEVIAFLREKGHAELSEIARHIGMGEAYTRRILNILEKEGLITITYNWTKFIAHWAGERQYVIPAEGTIIVEEKPEKRREISEIAKMGEASPREDKIERLREKFDEIKKIKAETESLQREREHLFEEKFIPLTTKMSAEIGAVCEIVREKEAELRKVRELVQNFSEKAEGIDLETQQFLLALRETRTKFADTISSLNAAISEMQKAQDEIRSELRACSQALNENEKEIKKFTQKIEEFNGDALHSAISRLRAKLNGYCSEVEAIERDFVSSSESLNAISTRIAALEKKVDNLIVMLNEIEKKADLAYEMQASIENARLRYARAMQSFEDEAKKYEKELEKVRERAIRKEIANYLNEIEKIEDKFRKEIAALTERSEEISKKISEKKAELKQKIESLRKEIKDYIA